MEIINRKLEITVAKLRLGHSRLKAHMYEIKLSDNPNCIYFDIPETVEHCQLNCQLLWYKMYMKKGCFETRYKQYIYIYIHTLPGGCKSDYDKTFEVVKASMTF